MNFYLMQSMLYDKENLYSETDKYLFFLEKQYSCFLDYINKNISNIYHYTSNKTIEKILKTSTLRFTNINELNDEYEFSYLFSVLFDRLPFYRMQYSKDFCDNLLDVCSNYCSEKYYYVSKYSKSTPERNFYVASFSLDNDNLPLWTLYTKEKNFIGCNFGFDIKTLKNTEEINNSTISGIVIYSPEEQIKILDELIATWYNYYEKISFEEYFKGDIHDALYKYALFFKHPAFRHEKEYRYVYFPNNNDNIQELNNKHYIDLKFSASDLIKSVKLSPTLKEDKHIQKMKKVFTKYKAKTEIFEISNIPFRN